MRTRIITFYSYEGGAGRTKTLADTAWVLASQGKRVLVVDWDLEAPGLHHCFRPFLRDCELRFSPGVMDLVWEFATAAVDPATPDEPDWHERLAAIQPYTVSVEHDFPGQGAIGLVPAGRQDHLYPTLVAAFDWDNFYERLGGGGFIEALKRRMREHYDYVLIDSRSGLGGTAGVCTVQLPDILVNCFALDTRAIDGAEAVAASVFRQRAHDELRMFPVPMRVGDGATERLAVARSHARATLGRYLSHLPAPEHYWREVEVPYSPVHADDDVLPPLKDTGRFRFTEFATTERIVAHLTDEGTSRPEQPELRSRDWLRRRGSRVFITYVYDSADHSKAVRELWFLLRGHGIDALLDRAPGQRQTDWGRWRREQLRTAELVLPVASPGYRRLPSLEAAQLRDVYHAFPNRFLPVVLPGGSRDGLPEFLNSGPAARWAEPASLTSEGVAPLAELIGRRALADKASHRAPLDPALAWGPARFDPELAEAGDVLAHAMYREHREELTRLRLGDPSPLPLRWSLSRRWITGSEPGSMAVTSGDLLDDPGRLFASLPNGRLVLLGAPGSGKTTAMRRLAVALLDMRASDRSVPVPVVLPLASWDPHAEHFTDWLVRRVCADHQLASELGPDTLARLVREGWVLSVLDGLEELPSHCRILAIENLHQSIAGGGYVMTSRTDAYEDADQRLGRPSVQATVLELEPLRREDVLVHLSGTRRPEDSRWDQVFHALGTDPSHPLTEVLRTPFMLQLAAEVYRLPSTDPAELLRYATGVEIQRHLVDAFLPAAYARHPSSGHSPDRARRWLTFLAAHMDRLQTVDFAWWQLHRVFSAWGMRLRLGGLYLLLCSPLLGLEFSAHGSSGVGLVAFVGATLALVVLTAARFRLPISCSPLFPRRVPMAAGGSPRASLRTDLQAALVPPLLLGMVNASLVASGVVTVLNGFLMAFLLGLTLIMCGSTSARYAVTVCWLAACGRTPWRLMRFLEDAHDRGVLRRIGAVYRFRHTLVQDVLAAQASQPDP